MKRFVLILLALVVALFNCTACNASTAQPKVSRPTLPQLINGIILRTENLNYISEQDSEVFAFYRNTPVHEITDAVFLDLLRRPPGTRIVKQSWSMFFQIQSRKDTSKRWMELQNYLETNLTNLTVVYLPRDAPYDSQYDLYAIGLCGDRVVGVQMFGVAT